MAKLTTDDRYAPLLATHAEDLLETEDRVRPADLLPVESKAQLVVSAAPDLIEAEKGLREIDILDKRGVAGAGDLERELLSLGLVPCVPGFSHNLLVAGRQPVQDKRAAFSCRCTFCETDLIRDHNPRSGAREGPGRAEGAP